VSWDKDGFQRLAAQVKSSLKGKPSPAGVPFFIYIYDPKEENRCLREFKNFAKGLQNEGFTIRTIYLGKVLSYVLKNLPYLQPEGRGIERNQREDLRKELVDKLPEKISDCLLHGIPGQFDSIGEDKPTRGVFLLRAGALFPFVHVSQILAQLENQTHSTIVIPFPGSLKEENLRFLNETEGHYYRAMIFGR
jgi:hypothetical protein